MKHIVLFLGIAAMLFAASLVVYKEASAPDGDIVVTSPVAGATIASPLQFSGKARGTYFFEASFPVRVVDDKRNVLGSGHAQATSDWMTTDFVPFEGTTEFTVPHTKNGTVVFAKDNPSGLPEHDASFAVPILFQQPTPSFGK